MTASRVGRWSRARRASASGPSTSDAHLDGQRALAGGRRHDVGAERLGDRVQTTEPGEAGARQDHRVEVVRDALEAGVDVAADVDDVQVRACGEQLGAAAGRAGADPGAEREVGELEPVARAEGVGGVLADRDRADDQAVGVAGRAGP